MNKNVKKGIGKALAASLAVGVVATVPANAASVSTTVTQATTATVKAEKDKTQASINAAKALVNKLSAKDAKTKTALTARLAKIQQIVTAYTAVTAAKASQSQTDLDKAVKAVSAMTSVVQSYKTAYAAENAKTQAAILAKAETLVAAAETSKKQADVNAAKTYLSTLGTKASAYSKRLGVVQTAIIATVTTAIEKAAASLTDADIAAAQTAVDELKTAITDGGKAAATDLSAKLEAAVALKNQALKVDSVTALANNKVKVALTEAIKFTPAASKFAIKDSASKDLEIKDAKLSADGKAVILTTAAQTAYTAYTLTTGETVKVYVALPTDSAKPTVSTVVPSDGNIVEVNFNEEVDAITGSNIANYTVNGLSILKAEVNGTKVTLTTAKQTVGSIYTLVTQNVTDLSGNVMDKNESLFGGTATDTDKVGLVTALSYSNTSVVLTFNDKLDQAAAENIANYSIDGLSILKAELDLDSSSGTYKTKVTLTTSSQNVGSLYKVIIKDTLKDKVGNAFNTDTDEVLFGGMAKDTTKPVVSTVVANSGKKVVVAFTEQKLDKASAENIANYSIAGLTIVKAELDSTAKVVTLTTSTQEVGKLYTLKTTAVKDAEGNILDGTNESMFGGTALDTDGPTVSSVSAANKTVTIVFNEEVDKASAETLTNYVFDGGLGYAVKAVKDTTLDSTGKTVVLTIADQKAGTIYHVTVSNVKDTNGNAIVTKDDASKKAFVGVTSSSAVGPKLSAVIPVSKNSIDLVFDQDMAATADGVVTLTLAITDANGTAITYPTGLSNSTIIGIRQADKKVVRVDFGAAGHLNDTVFEAGKVYKANVTGVTNVDTLPLQIANADDHIKAFAGTNTDDAKPYVAAAVAVDASTIDVTFSEPVTNVAAGDFAIVRQDGTVITTAVSSVFSNGSAVTGSNRVSSVRLYLSGAALESGKVYTLKTTSTGINDAAGFDVLNENTDDNLTYNVALAGLSTANVAPKVATAYVANEHTLKVVFSEAVTGTGLAEATVASNWSVTRTSGAADALATKNLTGAKVVMGNGNTEMTIYLDGAITNNNLVPGAVYEVAYTGSVANITDLAGLAFDADAADKKAAFGGTSVANPEMTIVSATGDVSDKTIKITLSEGVRGTALTDVVNNAASYAVYARGTTTSAVTSVDTAVYNAADNTVTLTFTGTLSATTLYDIKVTGAVKDYNNKNIKSDNTTTFTLLP